MKPNADGNESDARAARAERDFLFSKLESLRTEVVRAQVVASIPQFLAWLGYAASVRSRLPIGVGLSVAAILWGVGAIAFRRAFAAYRQFADARFDFQNRFGPVATSAVASLSLPRFILSIFGAPSLLWLALAVRDTRFVFDLNIPHPVPSTSSGQDASTDGGESATQDGGAPSDAHAPVPSVVPQPDPACPKWTTFLRGGQLDFGADAGATRQIENLCIGTTEVPVGDYDACVEKGPCGSQKRDTPYPMEVGDPKLDAYACTYPRRRLVPTEPINCVDRKAAAIYCAWVGGRLPTASEFEWAARGGPLGRAYPWGAAPPTDGVCWSPPNDAGSSRIEPCPVGDSPEDVSADGIRDLGGNVSEWTSSQTESFAYVVKGGRFNTGAYNVTAMKASESRAVSRNIRAPTIGFRCVVDLPDTSALGHAPQNCDPPYTQDDAGVRTQKPECR